MQLHAQYAREGVDPDDVERRGYDVEADTAHPVGGLTVRTIVTTAQAQRFVVAS